MNTALPEKIGRYQVLERVGKGGMGVLYRAFDPVLDREVAVKVMLADFTDDTDQMRPRFYREAKAAAKLQHRNIVTVFEFAEENNQPHIVMEFLRGIQLGTRMTESPPLTLPDKLDIVAQLCSGLGYAHTQGVVHRDVKPANVFLLTDGTVKLLDFGIAKVATSTLTQQGDVLGSAPYMSPEQLSGNQKLDGRSDVWSTGVLLYELLAGRKPFEGDDLTAVMVAILRGEPPSLDVLVPGLPPQLVAALGRALEKDPERRTRKPEELGRELQYIRQSLLASDLPPMDATRYASTGVLRALHDDRQKQATAGIGDKTLEGVAAGAAAPAAAAPPKSNTWMVAGGVAALALMALGGWAMFGRAPAPAAERAATSTSPPATVPAPAVIVPSETATKPATAATEPAGGATQPAGATQSGAIPLPAPSTVPQAAVAAPATPAPIETLPAKPAAAKAVPPARAADKKAAATSAGDTIKPAPAAPRSASGPLVAVSLSAPYPFEVMDGGRSISAPATSHELPPQPNGKTLRLVAADVFLDHPVRVDGGSDGRFEYSPPSLGKIDIRAARGDCRIMVGKRDLGFGPFPPVPAVAGDYQVSLACPDGQNPVIQTTVTQGFTARVVFKN